MEKLRGMIHVYTGGGKGKTTAAFGLAMRAAGHGWRALVVQFMKGREYGELVSARAVPGLEVEQYGRDEFVDRDSPAAVDVEFAARGMARAVEAFAQGCYDLIVLDEINVAVDFGLVKLEDVLSLLKMKPEALEVVCTGRYAPDALVEAADYVTEMREAAHPYRNDIEGRKGIEF